MSKVGNRESGKPASKREQSRTRSNYAEREQVRRRSKLKKKCSKGKNNRQKACTIQEKFVPLQHSS